MKTIFHLSVAAILGGVFAGFFINALSLAVEIFQKNANILVWFTPLAGIALYYLGQCKYFRNCEKENSPALTPFMYLASFWSQLFGASVGREGAAVQIGASVSEFIRRRFKHEENHRAYFAHAGVASAFCVALGTPFSAVIFALEYKKHLNQKNLLASLFGSSLGWIVLQVLLVKRWDAPKVPVDFSYINYSGVLFLSVLLWLLAQSFYQSEQFYSRVFSWLPQWVTLPASGVILGLASMLVGGYQFNNFGLSLLDQSFQSPADFFTAACKILFTFICLSGGWKGGSFVPLMVGGGLFASWCSHFINLPTPLCTSVGVFAVIALKFDIPMTAPIITAELFGWQAGLLSIPLHLLLKYLRPKISFDRIVRNKNRQENLSSI